MGDVNQTPAGFESATPHLIVRNANEAIEFYVRAFGAEELGRLLSPDEEFIIHATLRLGDSRIMLCDEMPGTQRWVSPQALNGTSVALHLQCADADAAFERAVKAGAKVSMPLDDMFWGARYGRLVDPFGHEWSISTPQQDLSPEELARATAAAFDKTP